MKTLLSALLIAAVAVGSSIIYSEYDNQFGAITSISGSDQISSSRTTINDNFTDLDTTKMEMSTTSVDSITTLSNLSSVGTITTGTWNGTALTVAYGGTGSTSPSTYRVMIGDGANGFTVASSTGTNGQFLTSSGAGAYPTWTTSAINQADDYTWTGTHAFATTTTIGESAGGLTPAGSLVAYATTTAPAGWLLADGSTYATATYPNLFAVIGYSYGNSGANFDLPDLSGRGVLMASSTPNIGQTGGESNHTMTSAELVGHTHNFTTYNSAGSTDGTISEGSGATASGVTTSTGSGDPFNVLDPYIVLNYIIKY